MRRLIGLLLFISIPLATMAQTDYPIHDDFRAACRITAPLGRGVLGIENKERENVSVISLLVIHTLDARAFEIWSNSILSTKAASRAELAIFAIWRYWRCDLL